VPKAKTAFDTGKITINTPTTEAVKSNFNVMAVMKALTNFAGDLATEAFTHLYSKTFNTRNKTGTPTKTRGTFHFKLEK
jgi:hypothetical protein